MSRLDRDYLLSRNIGSWKEAFREAGDLLQIAPASLKNLRDEFDPVHANARRGWWKRPLRPNRQRIMGELCDISDNAILEMVDRILRRDREAIEEVMRPLSETSGRKQIANVAERLRTGGLAEAFFLRNSSSIVDVEQASILDHRALARGYDFGVKDRPAIAIEVKGLKQMRGGITFTDREWIEAIARRANYWLVVVGNIESRPMARTMCDPASTLKAKCVYQTTIAASWKSNVDIALM